MPIVTARSPQAIDRERRRKAGEDERRAFAAVLRERQRTAIFDDHRCWKCQDGAKPCAQGNPRQCEYPRARND